MGQFCSFCSDSSEKSKTSVFQSSSQDEQHPDSAQNSSSHHRNASSSLHQPIIETDPSKQQHHHHQQQRDILEEDRKQRAEQARLEQIVSAAGRDMVTMHNNRIGYFDPEYAELSRKGAAPAADIRIKGEDFKTIPATAVDVLSVLEVLSNIQSEASSNDFLEECADEIMEKLVPTREGLFRGLDSIVENLP